MEGATILKCNQAHICLIYEFVYVYCLQMLPRELLCLRTINNNDSGQALAPANVAYEDDFNKVAQTHILSRNPGSRDTYDGGGLTHSNISTTDAYVTTTEICLPGTDPTPEKSTNEVEGNMILTPQAGKALGRVWQRRPTYHHLIREGIRGVTSFPACFTKAVDGKTTTLRVQPSGGIG